MHPLTIIHTADLHGDRHGAIDRAGRLKRAIPGSIWLDSGDALSGPNITLGLWTEDTLERMTEAGCTAMAMGNREFEPLVRCHRWKLSQAGFPVVCTNLKHPRPRTVPVVTEAQVRTRQGRVVRVMAALRDMVPGSLNRAITPYSFRHHVEALQARCCEAKDDETIILLSHLGREADEELLAEFPQVDLILGGHDHSSWLTRRDGRAALAPPPYGEALSVVRLTPGQAPSVRFSPPTEEAQIVAEATA